MLCEFENFIFKADLVSGHSKTVGEIAISTKHKKKNTIELKISSFVKLVKKRKLYSVPQRVYTL